VGLDRFSQVPLEKAASVSQFWGLLKEKGIYVGINAPVSKEKANPASQASPWGEDAMVLPEGLYQQGWALGSIALSTGGPFAFFDHPQVLDPGDGMLSNLIHQRVLGVPFVAQWSGVWPNEYRAENPLLLSAYASFQGWTGCVGLGIGPEEGGGELVSGEDLNFDPIASLQWPVAALAFLRGDLREGRLSVLENQASPGNLKALAHRSGLKGENPKIHSDPTGELKAKIQPKLKSFLSDTGQIHWQGNVGVVQVDSPRFQALIGFLANRKFNNAYWSAETSNAFASLSLISLTNQSLAETNHLLITGVTRMENTGMVYNAIKTKVMEAGRGPILYEPLEVRIVLYRLKKEAGLKLRALDAQGVPLPKKISYKWVKNNLAFSWIPEAFYIEAYK
jgi:hypothetical protein